MLNALRVALSVSALAVVIGETTPTPTPWPMSFSIDFVSNITTAVSDPSSSDAVSGKMYYDWNAQLQRVDHGAGSFECVNFYNSDLPCYLYFTPDGLYRILTAPFPEGQEECCLDMDSIHASPPDWMVTTLPTYNGQVKDTYSNMLTNKFTFDLNNTQDFPHMYYELVANADAGVDAELVGNPQLFTFPNDDGRQDFHYDGTSLKEGPQDKTLFHIPRECVMKMCSNPSKRA